MHHEYSDNMVTPWGGMKEMKNVDRLDGHKEKTT